MMQTKVKMFANKVKLSYTYSIWVIKNIEFRDEL